MTIHPPLVLRPDVISATPALGLRCGFLQLQLLSAEMSELATYSPESHCVGASYKMLCTDTREASARVRWTGIVRETRLTVSRSR